MHIQQKRTGRPHAPIADYVTKISHFLVLGYSLKQSCLLGNIPYSTVMDHYRSNQSIRSKIDTFMTHVGLKARSNWVSAINAGDLKASREWLERHEPDEFLRHRSEKEKQHTFRISPIENHPILDKRVSGVIPKA